MLPGGRQEVQPDRRSGEARHRRHVERRHLRVHRGLAAAGHVPPRDQHDRQLHLDRLLAGRRRQADDAGRRSVSHADPQEPDQAASASIYRTASTTCRTSTAAGSSRTSRCCRRSNTRMPRPTRTSTLGARYEVKPQLGRRRAFGRARRRVAARDPQLDLDQRLNPRLQTFTHQSPIGHWSVSVWQTDPRLAEHRREHVVR